MQIFSKLVEKHNQEQENKRQTDREKIAQTVGDVGRCIIGQRGGRLGRYSPDRR